MAKDKSQPQAQQKQETPVEEKTGAETNSPESAKMSAEDALLLAQETIALLEKRNADLRGEVERSLNLLMESANNEGRLERENSDLKERLGEAEKVNSGLLIRISEMESAPVEAPAKKPSADLSALPISEQLALLERGLKDTLTTVEELHAEIDKRKAAVAELREMVEVLDPKSYAVPQQGNILPQKGQRVSKHRHPGLFAAIVSQGRVGIHFHFVAP